MSDRIETPVEAGSGTGRPHLRAGVSVTTQPIAAIGGLEPEFLRTAEVRTVFGLARGTLYNLAAAGKIRGVLLRATGKKSGIRIWSVESIRAYIRSQMAPVEGEVAA